MPRFYLEFDEDDRFDLTLALALRIGNPPQTSEVDLGQQSRYVNHLSLMRRLLEAPKLPEGQASAQTAPPAAVPSARPPANTPPEPTPAVEHDKKIPLEGELTITPVSVEQDGKSMVVSYQIRSGQKTRMTKTRCWDPKLFSALLATVGQTTTFLTRESKGFLNIVGVKA
jgi:hypothetical protein